MQTIQSEGGRQQDLNIAIKCMTNVICQANGWHLFYYCKPVLLIGNLPLYHHHHDHPNIVSAVLEWRTFRKSLCNFFSVSVQVFFGPKVVFVSEKCIA